MGRTRVDWGAHIAMQARSGLSVTRYCRKEGISTWSFYTRRKRLRERRDITPSRSTAAETARAEASGGMSFINIGSLRAGPQLTVRLADATALEFAAMPAAEYLAVLVASLKRPPAHGTDRC